METNGLLGMLFAAAGFISLVFMCSSETRERVEKVVAKENHSKRNFEFTGRR